MKQLELARDFYFACRPILMKELPDVMSHAAFGFSGDSAQCFGVDGEECGTGFSIWIPRDIIHTSEASLEKALDKLPVDFAGQPSLMQKHLRTGNFGPLALESFYSTYTGLTKPPQNLRQWLDIPDWGLACATSGVVFEDNPGIFSQWRNALLEYYPRDVWLKKIAVALGRMASYGQRELPRMLRRNDCPAAMLAIARFSEAALWFVWLLNRRFMPPWQYAHILSNELGTPAQALCGLLVELARHPLRGKCDLDVAELVEDFCVICGAHLRASGISEEEDTWLMAHAAMAEMKIKDPALRNTPLYRDIL